MVPVAAARAEARADGETGPVVVGLGVVGDLAEEAGAVGVDEVREVDLAAAVHDVELRCEAGDLAVGVVGEGVAAGELVVEARARLLEELPRGACPLSECVGATEAAGRSSGRSRRSLGSVERCGDRVGDARSRGPPRHGGHVPSCSRPALAPSNLARHDFAPEVAHASASNVAALEGGVRVLHAAGRACSAPSLLTALITPSSHLPVVLSGGTRPPSLPPMGTLPAQ